MRLGTFRSVNDPEAFECSVIILGGEAGGLDSNLARWIGQVGLPLTQQNRQALVSKAHSTKTKGGLDVIVYDLTVLQNGNMGEKSMMVGVFAIEGSSVFVKITGTVAEINKERDNFMSFVKSLSRK